MNHEPIRTNDAAEGRNLPEQGMLEGGASAVRLQGAPLFSTKSTCAFAPCQIVTYTPVGNDYSCRDRFGPDLNPAHIEQLQSAGGGPGPLGPPDGGTPMGGQPGTTTGLVDRHRNGDEKAGAELLDHAGKRLEVLARRMLRRYPVVRNRGDTFDLMQETNMRLMKALEQVQPKSSMHWWNILRKHLRWAAISMARSCKTKPLVHQHDVENLVDRYDDSNEPVTFEEWVEFHEQVELLPKEEREVMDLRFYGALSVKDTATVLKISEKTVKRRFRKAKRLLAAALRRFCGESEGRP